MSSAEDDARQAAGYEGAYQCNRKEHGRSELNVSLPKRSDVVEGLNRRGYGNQQGREGEDGTQKRIHSRHKHVVTPNNEG